MKKNITIIFTLLIMIGCTSASGIKPENEISIIDSPSVVIEHKFIEINQNDLDQFGFDWVIEKKTQSNNNLNK